MNVLAVDTGYSATKIYSEVKGSRKTLIFPSVIGPAEFGEDFLGTKEENFIAELSLYPGKVRNFGERQQSKYPAPNPGTPEADKAPHAIGK